LHSRVARYSRATDSTVIFFCRINPSIWVVPAVIPCPFALPLLPGPSVYTSGAAHPTALLALFQLPFNDYSYNKRRSVADICRIRFRQGYTTAVAFCSTIRAVFFGPHSAIGAFLLIALPKDNPAKYARSSQSR
jgi:hypothetical protein